MSSSAYVNKKFKDVILDAASLLNEDADDRAWVRGINGHNELFFNKKEGGFSFYICFKFNKDKTVSFKLARTRWSYSENGLLEEDIVSEKDLFSGKCELNFDVLYKVALALDTAQYQNVLGQTERKPTTKG